MKKMYMLVSKNEVIRLKEVVSDFKRYIKEPRNFCDKKWMEQEIKDAQEIVDKYLKDTSSTIEDLVNN